MNFEHPTLRGEAGAWLGVDYCLIWAFNTIYLEKKNDLLCLKKYLFSLLITLTKWGG